MRIIDAKHIEKQVKEAFEKTNPVLMGCLLRWIRYQPTIDAVPVVRCRECKFRSSWMMNRNLRYICPESGMFPNCENDFCSRGERKGGDNND